MADDGVGGERYIAAVAVAVTETTTCPKDRPERAVGRVGRPCPAAARRPVVRWKDPSSGYPLAAAALITVPDLASLWLENNAYMESERGFPGMVVSSGEILKLVVASHHIKTPTSIGDLRYVECVLDVFALASYLVRCFFETKAGLRTRRRARIGEGIFDSWRSELAGLVCYLSQDDAGPPWPAHY